MTDISYPSSARSFSERLTKEEETVLYKTVQTNIETIRKATNDINVLLERLKKEMNVTQALMNELIETKTSTASTD
ncbi:hypothetical protein CAJAP_08108 [Camponotus japonicus]